MKTISLHDLLAAVSGAVAGSARAIGQEHLKNFSDHFAPNGDGVMEPKSVPLKLPRHHHEAGDPPDQVANVPLATLIHHKQVLLDELKLEIECAIDDFEKGVDGAPGLLSLIVGGGASRSKHGPARMTISYRAHDTPEGIAQVNDSLLRHSDHGTG